MLAGARANLRRSPHKTTAQPVSRKDRRTNANEHRTSSVDRRDVGEAAERDPTRPTPRAPGHARGAPDAVKASRQHGVVADDPRGIPAVGQTVCLTQKRSAWTTQGRSTSATLRLGISRQRNWWRSRRGPGNSSKRNAPGG